jgi:hypothetical protein
MNRNASPYSTTQEAHSMSSKMADAAKNQQPVAWLVIPNSPVGHAYATTIKPSASVQTLALCVPLGAIDQEWRVKMEHWLERLDERLAERRP